MKTPGDNMPEPDCGLFSGEQVQHMPHPRKAELIIEVSDSSIDLDREKARDCTAAGIPDYKILDVIDRKVEMFRKPIAYPVAQNGFRYLVKRVLTGAGVIVPIVCTGAGVAVKTLLST